MLKRPFAAAVVALAAALFPALPTLADDLPIERIAPKKSVLVAGMKNFTESRARLERTPLWGLWQSDQVQSVVKDLMKDVAGEDAQTDEEFWEELGFKPEDVPPPTGAVGIAVFIERDEEIGQDVPAVLAVAEYGDGAEKAQELLDKLVERARKDGAVIDDRDVRGRKVYSMELPEEDPAAAAGDEFDAGPAAGPFSAIKSLHWCRDGSRFLGSSSLVSLEDALEVADGALDLDSVGRDPDYQAAIAQIDSTDGTAVLLTANMKPLIAPLLVGPGAVVEPLIGKLFGDIRAWSFGMSIDGKVGMIEQSAAAYVPGEKAGLLSMLTTATAGGVLPSFVGVDGIGYGRINVELSKLMPLVSDVVKSLPEMMRDEIEPQLDQFAPMLEEAFANLGPEIHTMTTLSEPLTAESQSTLVAIRCTKPESVKPLVDMLAPSSGMTPRDFLGQTIYSSEFAPFAIGLGGGWLTLGPNSAVEQVLRSVGQANLPGLADEELFRYAVGSIRSEKVVGWGYSNLVASFAYQREMMKQTMKDLEAMKAEFGDEMGDIDDVAGLAGLVAKHADAMTPEFLARYLGPATWELTVGDKGFVMRSYTLPPKKPN